jgi:hypothetical protein
MDLRIDPLSDEAMYEHFGGVPDADYVQGWQECARRAHEQRDEDLESLHVYYRAENLRLREGIESMLLAHAKKEGEWLESLKPLLEANERLRDLLARCNAFNALDCIEAKQADKEARAATKEKE